MALESVKHKLMQQPEDRVLTYFLQHNSHASNSAIQAVLSNYSNSIEVKDQSVSVIVPMSTGGIATIAHQIALSNLMSIMDLRFDGVSLFLRVNQHRDSKKQTIYRQELLVKSWATLDLLLENLEELLDFVANIGEVFCQEKMSLLIESPDGRLMVRVATDFCQKKSQEA